MSFDSRGFCCPIARQTCCGYYSWRAGVPGESNSRDIGGSRALRFIHIDAPTQSIFKRNMRALLPHSFISWYATTQWDPSHP